MTSGNFGNKSHAVGLNQHHFEWCPKYRLNAMRKSETAEQLKQILYDIAKENGILIHEAVVDINHVHLFVSLPFSLSVSKALQYFKGGSSYRIFRLHPNLRKMYRKGHFWSPGKFSRSISNVTSKTIANYIKNHDYAALNQTIQTAQDEPHQLNLTNYAA